MKKIAIYLSILFVIGISLGINANASGHDIITEWDDTGSGGGSEVTFCENAGNPKIGRCIPDYDTNNGFKCQTTVAGSAMNDCTGTYTKSI